MKTKEKAFHGGRKMELGPEGRKRLGDVAHHKDVKNEDRSGDMYENKCRVTK